MLRYVQQSLLRLVSELLHIQRVQPYLSPAHGLHQGHLKGISNAHHFASGLHLGAQVPLGVHKLVKGPLGEFHRHIVYGGLEGRVCHARHRVLYLVQPVADSYLSCDLGYGIAGGL